MSSLGSLLIQAYEALEFVKDTLINTYCHPGKSVICNKAASDRGINLFNRVQHARYKHHIVVASVYKGLTQLSKHRGT
jgi:hypothetical protein